MLSMLSLADFGSLIVQLSKHQNTLLHPTRVLNLCKLLILSTSCSSRSTQKCRSNYCYCRRCAAGCTANCCWRCWDAVVVDYWSMFIEIDWHSLQTHNTETKASLGFTLPLVSIIIVPQCPYSSSTIVSPTLYLFSAPPGKAGYQYSLQMAVNVTSALPSVSREICFHVK